MPEIVGGLKHEFASVTFGVDRKVVEFLRYEADRRGKELGQSITQSDLAREALVDWLVEKSNFVEPGDNRRTLIEWACCLKEKPLVRIRKPGGFWIEEVSKESGPVNRYARLEVDVEKCALAESGYEALLNAHPSLRTRVKEELDKEFTQFTFMGLNRLQRVEKKLEIANRLLNKSGSVALNPE